MLIIVFFVSIFEKFDPEPGDICKIYSAKNLKWVRGKVLSIGFFVEFLEHNNKKNRWFHVLSTNDQPRIRYKSNEQIFMIDADNIIYHNEMMVIDQIFFLIFPPVNVCKTHGHGLLRKKSCTTKISTCRISRKIVQFMLQLSQELLGVLRNFDFF